MKTNYSIFTRVLVLAICFIMLVGGLTACFQEAAPENNVVTTTPNNNGSTSNGGNTENNGGELEVILPPHVDDVLISTPVTPDAENKVPEGGVNMSGESASATVPGGVQMEEGATELALTINGIEQSEAQIELLENEVSTSFDVHVAGVAQGNLVPMEITLAKAVAKGLNSTSIKLYHVEDGVTYEMTRIANDEAFTAHNQFKYDPATGDVTISIASFSEIALVVNELNAWKGNFDYTWYDATKTELFIANADQLAAFGAIVGGMKEVKDRDEDGNYTYSDDFFPQDSFSSKTVTLLADINLGDVEEDKKIFYPIGYWNEDGTYERTNKAISSGFYTFCGTFDGNGHIIANFYHNTWEMKGDNDEYSLSLQYYRDGMGLFGRVYKGTIKNLTVKNFSSDGEYTTTGVIAAYADGATFENISIFNCNPRVYNIGNGGIVGCVGWYAKEAGLTTSFKNITVDNTNKISALWGSWDVACGGILGQYYPTSGQTSAGKPANGGVHFENCHVSAQIDVYNDVCANYQYYAYRYAGMIIGSVRENITVNGNVYPKMDGISANNCTVNFGTWNDYYYCELVANSLASYTHDHQMSRLTQVEDVDVENNQYIPLGETEWVDIPTLGRVNYVVVNGDHATENATCYHFVDGVVWTHEQAEKEIVDGVEVLKEDKQHIYLEFNNLFTGYGWGVTSMGINNWHGFKVLGVGQGNIEASVPKFEFNKDLTTITNNREYKLSEIFKYLDDCGVNVAPGSLAIFLTNLDENGNVTEKNNVTANIVYDKDEWYNGTITFTGAGRVQITIQDYYFCTPTTIEVVIVCNEHTQGETVNEIVNAPTCTEGGSHDEVVYCTVCGEELSRENVADAKLGHDWSKDPYNCSRTDCGEEAETKIIYFYNNWDWTTPQFSFLGHTLNMTDKKVEGSYATYTIKLPTYVEKFTVHGGSDISTEIPNDKNLVEGAIYSMLYENNQMHLVATVKVSLKPNDYWKKNNAWFAAYVWINDKATAWVKLTDTNSDDIYEGYVPAGYDNIIFARMNKSVSSTSISSYDFDNAWRQTGDLKISTLTNNTYTVNEVYLQPSSAWKEASARFAVYFYNSNKSPVTFEWGSMSDGDGDGIYECAIPTGDAWNNVIFCRMNPASDENNWNDDSNGNRVWAQTIDISMNNVQNKTYSFTTNKLYFKPNSNWKQSNAWFAAYFFNNSTGKNTWVKMTDTDKDGVYECEIPSGTWPNVIFCRMKNTNTTTLDWSNVWNQTSDLGMSSIFNYYEVTGDSWSNGTGDWKTK